MKLYRADFLAGFTVPDSGDFDDWQTFQTEQLRMEFVDALDRPDPILRPAAVA
ncbi:MAG: hypothetical protein U0521_22660 [Anaerolineae bacterium]